MKHFFTILGLCMIFIVFALMVIIYSKYPNTKLDSGHFIKTEISQTNGPFVPNYKNTNIFSCGGVRFSMNLTEQMLNFRNITNSEWWSTFYWATDWSEEKNHQIKFICNSTKHYKELSDEMDVFVKSDDNVDSLVNSSEYKEMFHEDEDGYSIVTDKSMWTDEGYKFDIVYKKNQFNTESDKEYVLFKSKPVFNKEDDIAVNIDIWYHTNTLDETSVHTFQEIFDSIKILE